MQDLRLNEQAMKKSKDITVNFNSRKQMFDQLNMEAEEIEENIMHANDNVTAKKNPDEDSEVLKSRNLLPS